MKPRGAAVIRSVRDLLRSRFGSAGGQAGDAPPAADGTAGGPAGTAALPAGLGLPERLPFTASEPLAPTSPEDPAAEQASDRAGADGTDRLDAAVGDEFPENDPEPSAPASYQDRLTRETTRFADETEVHDLPAIYHYWSHTYLRPKLAAFGATGIEEYFANQLERAIRDAPERPARFISIGAGNSDTEIQVARLLADRGRRDFVLECLEITDEMLSRGRELAAERGVAELVHPVRGDFNHWVPVRRYDAVLANQSLHHVVDLEALFDAIAGCLRPSGRFVTSDMIGRNGHLRWPEALQIVQEFWAELPDDYRYHRQLRRQEDAYLDWDCSTEGFEGIRAQDVLPLLIERFAFEDFLAFGNLIDPFIDRGFGPHFDADAAWDRDFIDRVHARDERELAAGSITPTHLLATMRVRSWAGATRTWAGMTPQSCVRRPD